VQCLKSPFLTTGPAVDSFEAKIAAYTGAKHCVAVMNGTAALHAAMFAAGIGEGDEVRVLRSVEVISRLSPCVGVLFKPTSNDACPCYSHLLHCRSLLRTSHLRHLPMLSVIVAAPSFSPVCDCLS
jgi:cystathionine beta-lyase/cystathionine gamma-synthase